MANNTLHIGGYVTSQEKLASKESALAFLHPTSAVNPQPDVQEMMLCSVYREKSGVQHNGESAEHHQKVCSKIGTESRSPEPWAFPLQNHSYCSLKHWIDLLQAFFTDLKIVGGTLSALYLDTAQEPSDNFCIIRFTSAGALIHPLESHPFWNVSDFIYFQPSSLDLIIPFPAKINKLSAVRCLFINERLNIRTRIQSSNHSQSSFLNL